MKGKLKMEKKTNYTEMDRAIVSALKEGDMTLAELSDKIGLKVVAGHIVSAMKKGLVAKNGEKEITKPGIKTVNTYTFVTADVQKKADGSDYSYSDGEKAILAVAASFDDKFTLADLSDVYGSKIAAGSITSLVKKGNLGKGEPVDLPVSKVSKVSVYTFVADIPDAE